MKIVVLIPPSNTNVARDLLYGCWCKGKRIGGVEFPPITQTLFATVLRNRGYDVEVKEDLNFKADRVYMLTSTMTINEDARVLKKLKERNLTTVVYGSHPTFMPEQTLAKEGIDEIIKGEPDYEENLDNLPITDRTLIRRDYFNPVVKRFPFTTMTTSRGCPGRCIFCSVPRFYGRKIRWQSVDRVVKELKVIKSQGFKEVFFRDENFTTNRNRLWDLCYDINRMNLTWICSSRVDYVDRNLLIWMKWTGCHMIRFGVESGSQRILDNLKKDITLEQIRQAFKWCNEIKLDTHAHCMIGSPGETKETIRETIDFVKEINPTIVTFGICTPYPGTELFDRVVKAYPEIKDGSDCDLTRLHTKAFFNVFTKLSAVELERAITQAYRKFYLRPSYLWKQSLNLRTIKAGLKVLTFSMRGE